MVAVLLRSASDFVAVRGGFPVGEFLFSPNRYSARCTSKIPAHDSMRVAQSRTLAMYVFRISTALCGSSYPTRSSLLPKSTIILAFRPHRGTQKLTIERGF